MPCEACVYVTKISLGQCDAVCVTAAIVFSLSFQAEDKGKMTLVAGLFCLCCSRCHEGRLILLKRFTDVDTATSPERSMNLDRSARRSNQLMNVTRVNAAVITLCDKHQ